MEKTKNNCTGMGEKLADLLFDPAAAPAKVQTHVAECERCQTELAELKATMACSTTWKAPEPSPYFLSSWMRGCGKSARLRRPAGWRWIAGFRAGFAYGPAATSAAGCDGPDRLAVDGRRNLPGRDGLNHPDQPPTQTAVVHDLQLLDNNAQLLDQLESISEHAARRGLAVHTFGQWPRERFVNWMLNARTVRTAGLTAAVLVVCLPMAGRAAGSTSATIRDLATPRDANAPGRRPQPEGKRQRALTRLGPQGTRMGSAPQQAYPQRPYPQQAIRRAAARPAYPGPAVMDSRALTEASGTVPAGQTPNAAPCAAGAPARLAQSAPERNCRRTRSGCCRAIPASSGFLPRTSNG